MTTIVSDSSADAAAETLEINTMSYRHHRAVGSAALTEKCQDDEDSMDDFIVDDEDSE